MSLQLSLTPLRRVQPHLKPSRTTPHLSSTAPKRELPKLKATQKSFGDSSPRGKANFSRHASVPNQLSSLKMRDSSLKPLQRKNPLPEESKTLRLKPMAERLQSSKAALRRRLHLDGNDNTTDNTLSPTNILSKSAHQAHLKFTRLIQGRVPRTIDKLSWKTKTGMLNGQPKRFNQDNYLLVTDFADVKNQLIVGVMDGHGTYGHEASKYVRKHLPGRLLDAFPSLAKTSSELLFDVDKFIELENSFKSAYIAVNTQLRKDIDVVFSGTTAATCLIRDRDVFCANVGDSRVLIGRQIGNSWEAIPLSIDHKPDDPLERARILKHGGRVEPIMNEDRSFVGPARVWLKTENVPGLAMSRSLGDVVAARVGVSATPDVKAHRLTKDDKFLLLGTDGLFEFMTNESIVELVSPFVATKDAEGACECLVKEATHRWIDLGPIVDDITVVLVFFKPFD
mmetsp:Transcript_9508/g.18397  ORF Transcript_9508/g.18397 Transcript_9508/m.18397 type:complete len:453 (-) Transcript_9508:1638-2996(-)